MLKKLDLDIYLHTHTYIYVCKYIQTVNKERDWFQSLICTCIHVCIYMYHVMKGTFFLDFDFMHLLKYIKWYCKYKRAKSSNSMF